jgi:hypothetical protein
MSSSHQIFNVDKIRITSKVFGKPESPEQEDNSYTVLKITVIDSKDHVTLIDLFVNHHALCKINKEDGSVIDLAPMLFEAEDKE